MYIYIDIDIDTILDLSSIAESKITKSMIWEAIKLYPIGAYSCKCPFLFTHSKDISDMQFLKIMAAISSLRSRLVQQWGSMFACVQITKTLHAQHKQNIRRVFSKK